MLNVDRLYLHNKIIKDLAAKTGKPLDVIEQIVRSQWEIVYDTITELEEDKRFLGVKIKYLGCFGISNLRFKNSTIYKDYYVPKEDNVKDIDPREYRKTKHGRKDL